MFHPQSHSLSSMDSEINDLVGLELKRQEEGLEMIASENYASRAVMEAQGTILTNKYAEGYPKKRYYGGCENVDSIETVAIERVSQLFGVKYANVQPHSGSGANMGAYFALLEPGDTVLGLDLAQGGHLTHGSPVNFSGKLFNIVSYGLDPETETIDMDKVLELAKKHKPKVIVTGASAYPRTIEFAKFREIADEVGAYVLSDMAHIAGLVAAGLHPTPCDVSHVTTSTTHKTLRGPRGGIILCNDEDLAKKINFNIFPGIQGGPLEHVIASKAVAFKEASLPEFKDYQKRVIENAKVLAEELQAGGADLVSGGTDNHLILLKTDSFNLTGKVAEKVVEHAGITVNKNMIPNDSRSPFVTSGIRLGTPAITTRGLDTSHMKQLAGLICKALKNPEEETVLKSIRGEVLELCQQFPVYKD